MLRHRAPEGRGRVGVGRARSSGARLVLTCEHGGHRVPAAWRHLFAGRRAMLASHRAWDPGALAVARALSRTLDTPLIASTTTRLLIDPNRSPHNPAVFSQWTRDLPRATRNALLERHHRPHWDRVRAEVRRSRGVTLHVAVHSFTPVWNGRPRGIDVGILYDPGRRRERALAVAWQRRLRDALPGAVVRRNAPYRGDTDGLTTALRRERPADRYLGLELELSQAALATPAGRRAVVRAVAGLLAEETARPGFRGTPSRRTP